MSNATSQSQAPPPSAVISSSSPLPPPPPALRKPHQLLPKQAANTYPSSISSSPPNISLAAQTPHRSLSFLTPAAVFDTTPANFPTSLATVKSFASHSPYPQIHTKPSAKSPFVCKVCGRAFNHRSSYRAHEPTHTGAKPFQCNVCLKRFALQWNLVSHLHTHTGVRRYKCPKCNALFARSTTLREHMQVHLAPSQKPVFHCGACAKVFRSKKSLAGHRMVHAEKRPFECDICTRGFVSRRNLRNHQKAHKAECLYKCDVCEVWFRSAASLAVHRAQKHFSPEFSSFPKIISQMAARIELAVEGSATADRPDGKMAHNHAPPEKITELTQMTTHLLPITQPEEMTTQLGQNAVEADSSNDFVRQGKERAGAGTRQVKYPCEKCSLQFSEKPVWVEHMQKHFVDQFRCVCYVCGAPNASLGELRDHLEQHAAGAPPPPSSAPPKLAISNYDIKYFVSFFAQNGIDVPSPFPGLVRRGKIPPPPKLEKSAVGVGGGEEGVFRVGARDQDCGNVVVSRDREGE